MLGISNLSVVVLHETLLVPVLMHGSETMLWKEKEKSRIKDVQMDNLRGFFGIRKMDRVPNARIKVFSDGLDMWIITGSLRRCMQGSSRSVGRPRRRWIDTVNDC